MLLDSFPSRETFRDQAKTANVIPVASRILADMETPVSVLARFQGHAESLFLFESVEGGERWGRYSFMGTQAKVRVTVFREDVVVRQGIQQERIPHHGKPMDVLRKIMAPYKLASFPGQPRFCGGLVGYFSYEMVHFFEPRIPNKLPGEKPLADLMIPETLLVFDNVQNTLTVMALSFVQSGEDLDQAYMAATAKRDALLARLSEPAHLSVQQGSQRDLTPKPIIPEQKFRDQVLKVKEHIVCGDIIQCVLSQSFVCEVPEDRLGLYRAQRHLNPSPYMYYLHLGNTELVGSSPETMI
ncbi:MAG TPA: chorismate-binding protein, partial [Fibrobacteraceae bacterium]|nr:chorismate-binding protein [Fibrobacteraceae bacterium]